MTIDESATDRNAVLNPRSPRDYLRVFWWMFATPDILARLWDPPEGSPPPESRRDLVAIQQRVIALIMWFPYLVTVVWLGWALSDDGLLAYILALLLPAWLVSLVWTSEVVIPNFVLWPPRAWRPLRYLTPLRIPVWAALPASVFILVFGLEKPLAGVAALAVVVMSNCICWGLYHAYIEPKLVLNPPPDLRDSHPLRNWQPLMLIRHRAFTREQWIHLAIMAVGVAVLLGWSAWEDGPAGTPVISLAGLNLWVAVIVAFLLAISPWVVLIGGSHLAARAIGIVFRQPAGNELATLLRWDCLLVLAGCHAGLIWLLLLGGWRSL